MHSHEDVINGAAPELLGVLAPDILRPVSGSDWNLDDSSLRQTVPKQSTPISVPLIPLNRSKKKDNSPDVIDLDPLPIHRPAHVQRDHTVPHRDPLRRRHRCVDPHDLANDGVEIWECVYLVHAWGVGWELTEFGAEGGLMCGGDHEGEEGPGEGGAGGQEREGRV